MSNELITISPAQLDEIISRSIAKWREEIGLGPTSLKPIMTRAEARQYVRRTSDAAFSAWCARWQVRAECRGRWSRARLDLALAREAGTAHVPAGMRK